MALTDKLEVIKKAKEQASRGTDWNARKEIWLSRYNSLLEEVESHFKPMVEKGLLSVSRSDYPIDEEEVGRYSAPALKILVGNQEFRIEPMGTLLIGAFGRVDIRYYNKNESAMLLLTGDSIASSEWKMLYPRDALGVQPLTMVKIDDLLEKWLDL